MSILFLIILGLSSWYFYNKGKEHQKYLDNMYNPNNIKRRPNYEERHKEIN